MTARMKELAAVALAFCAWAVYVGGLSSLQATCAMDGIAAWGDGFNDWLSCSRTYGFYWFICFFEFVLVCAAGAAVVSGHLDKFNTSFVGLFAVLTMLFIEASRVWTPIEELPQFSEGQPMHRVRTIIAGCIMTAVANGIVVTVMGIEEGAAYKAPAKKDEAPKGADSA